MRTRAVKICPSRVPPPSFFPDAEEEKPREYAREYFSVPVLFEEPEETEPFVKTSVEAGLAYHAFLEHFDFSLLNAGEDSAAIAVAEKERMEREKLLSADRLALLDTKQLAHILENPVFSELSGMRLYREQQFLVSLPWREISKGKGRVGEGEEVLFPGRRRSARRRRCGRSANSLTINTLFKGKNICADIMPLSCFSTKRPVARIMNVDASAIRCTIVNIARGFEVEMG